MAVADTPATRSQGLRAVDDLGDLDGMLFRWEEEGSRTFTMRGTLIPLDIAFFGIDGRLVDMLRMVPCEAEPCPSYRATAPFAFAVEAPAGRFDELPAAAVLTVRPG